MPPPSLSALPKLPPLPSSTKHSSLQSTCSLICHPPRVGAHLPPPVCLACPALLCHPDLDDPLVPFAFALYLPVPHLSSPLVLICLKFSGSSSLSILTGLSLPLDAPLLPPTHLLPSPVQTGPSSPVHEVEQHLRVFLMLLHLHTVSVRIM